MARVTVEDCVLQIPNRFKLVLLAAQRARELSVGGELTVERDNDKNPVVALREIADQTIDLEQLEQACVQGLQKHVDVDEPVEESEEVLAMQEVLSAGGGFESVAEGDDDELGEGEEGGTGEPPIDDDGTEDDR